MSARWREALQGQEGRGFLWCPIALVAGIWLYFALPVEPHPLVFAVAAAAVGCLWLLGRRSAPAIGVMLILAGLLLAKARTEWVRAPVIQASTGPIAVTGFIERTERRGKRGAILLDVHHIEGLAPEQRPARLRLTVYREGLALRSGETISARAMLHPLPTPAMPGGFDYGRILWLEGVGGTGRIIGDIRVTASSDTLAGRLEGLRLIIGERIRAVLPGAAAAFGEAIITGERGAIPDEVNRSLQTSGLAHILSISGLHMTLVAGSVFWIVRAVLALSPMLALSFPIKKWAAAAALSIGFFYMMLAGADVATRRSYLMLAVMFFAVLVDRPALSMRNLAVAAVIILALEPEACLTAGFQMSFMAVMGLIALHEAWSDWRREHLEPAQPRGFAYRAVRHGWGLLGAMAATSLAAGALSSIPAAYHFGRLAPLSLLANVLALPFMSFIVMPAALLSVLLMPLGLEGLAVWLMGEGLGIILAISDWVAGLHLSRAVVPAQPLPSAIVVAAGAVWLCLWRGWPRLAGVAIAAAGMVLSGLGTPPDVLIERTAANVAIRDTQGRLAFAEARRGRFAAEKWLAANGEDAQLSGAAARSGWSCGGGICRASVKGKRLAYVRDGADPRGLCDGLDILIAAYPLRGACRGVPLRIDRFDVWRHGAHALYVAESVTVKTARGEQGRRPWTVTPKPRQRAARR